MSDEMKTGPVPKEALDYFRAKKLHPAFDAKDVWGEEHRFAFTVAKIAERSILKKVRDSLDAALSDGVPFQEWAKDLKPTLDQSGWADYGTENEAPSRLQKIYDTNMRMARANGQEDRAQRVKDVLPYFKYELGPSKEHRPEHEDWDGLILPVDDPFWDAHAPPSAFGCKCRRRQITQSETDDNGGPDEAPPDDMVEAEGPNGEKILTPDGVDPQFNYPKGTDGRRRALQDALDSAE